MLYNKQILIEGFLVLSLGASLRRISRPENPIFVNHYEIRHQMINEKRIFIDSSSSINKLFNKLINLSF